MIKPMPSPTLTLRRMACLAVLLPLSGLALAAPADEAPGLWALEPVVRPEVPTGLSTSSNPIDAFIAAGYQAQGLKPVGPADKRTLLRRVYLDLIGLPPTLDEQDAFLRDESPDAYEKVVDRLLASEQHGVRYGRHWLDVLRYADVDERMIAAPGHLPLARLGDPRAQRRPAVRPVRPRPADRVSVDRPGPGCRPPASAAGRSPGPTTSSPSGSSPAATVIRDGKDAGELPIAAVETVSTAFMGLTVGCAKCHDHMYDPIKQRDFYAMKALFDPLVVRKVTLATPAEIFASGKALDEAEAKRAALEEPINDIDRPLPEEAPRRPRRHAARRTSRPSSASPRSERSAAEQKIADDYFPVLRIDDGQDPGDHAGGRAEEIPRAPAAARPGRAAGEAVRCRRSGPWRSTRSGRLEKSYILTSGDPDRPEKNHEVEPGWPFAPADDRLPRGPDRGVLRLADRGREPAVRPGGRQPALAMALRRGPAQDAQRLRQAGRNARRTRRSSTGWPPSSSPAGSG